MPFSPEEIRSRGFVVALRGYDKVEVETFLQHVASQYEDLMAELELARVEGRSGSVVAADPFADLGDHVTSVMRAATDAAAHLRTESEQEAAAVRTIAQQEAERTLLEARLELEAASELRAEAEREAAQLRAVAQEEVARIKNEARKMLDAARETRSTVEGEVTELRESATRHEQELRTQAEQTVAQLIAAAKQEIEEAVRRVRLGCESLQRAEQDWSSPPLGVGPSRSETAEVPPARASGGSQTEDTAAS